MLWLKDRQHYEGLLYLVSDPTPAIKAPYRTYAPCKTAYAHVLEKHYQCTLD